MVRKRFKEKRKNRNKEELTDNWIGEEGVKAMCETLKTNTTLQSLNLDCKNEKRGEKIEKKGEEMQLFAGNEIGDDGAKAMCEMLKVNTTLISLNLWSDEE